MYAFAQGVVRLATDDGTVVCESCEVANGPLGRMRGLLGRTGLEPGSGMLLPSEPSVHTAFMRFPIDVVFLDRANKVVKVVHDLVPWRVAAARGARTTLELPAGTARMRGLEIGMTLVASPLDGAA